MNNSFTRDLIERALNCLESADNPLSVQEARRWLLDAERWRLLQHGLFTPTQQTLDLPRWLAPWVAARHLELRCPALKLQADEAALESLLRHSLPTSVQSGVLAVEQVLDGIRFRFEGCSVRLASPYQRALGQVIDASPVVDGWLYGQVPSSGVEDALIDFDVLDQATMHDRDFEVELVEAFLNEGRQNLRILSKSYATPTLHSFKGSAALVGARDLTARLQQQENTPDPRTLPLLEQEFERVEQALRKHLDRLR